MPSETPADDLKRKLNELTQTLLGITAAPAVGKPPAIPQKPAATGTDRSAPGGALPRTAPTSKLSDAQLHEALHKRLSDPGRTNVPADWKPGFFSSLFSGNSPPWGSLDEAWTLLSERQIEPGRELLSRICQAEPRNFDAHLLLAFDCGRPTQNREVGGPHFEAAQQLRPNSPEMEGLFALAGWNAGNAAGMDKSLGKMVSTREPISSRHGAFLSLLAIVAASDYWLQHYRPKPRSIDSTWAIAPVRGTAQLMHRQHVDALNTFSEGNNRSSQFLATFEKQWGCRLSSQDAEWLTYDYAMFCQLGQGLVLYDVGLSVATRQIVADAMRLTEWKGPVADFVHAAAKRL